MRAGDLTRPLALVFSRLGTQVTGRLVQLLQEPLREQVIEMLDDAAGLSPDRMVFVEQVLYADLLRVQEETQHEEGTPLLREVVPLQISDVVGFLFLHAPVQPVAEILLRLPAALQGEVLYKICVQNWSALARRLGRAELEFLRAFEAGWRGEGRSASPELGAEVLAHIASTAAVRRLLSDMYRLDPEVIVQVRDLLFGFQDLVRLSDREFQAVLAGVDAWDLALAMQTAPQNLRRRVLANIS
ncbi:MAG: hypothetical protein O2954_11930, partial [bacterium]|nr:hypothetical protein [bacterium]